MNRLSLTLCLSFACSTYGYRPYLSNFTRTPITFPQDDPYSCRTPYRRPGVCVPIEACPELKRVDVGRLSRFLCGFEVGDIPLLCCERQEAPPAAVVSPLLTRPSPGSSQPPRSLGPSRPQPIPPVPLLCSVSVVEGRRWKSCWYLALQRVVYPEDSNEPSPSDTSATTEDPLRPTSSITPEAVKPTRIPIGGVEPSKTSVTSD